MQKKLDFKKKYVYLHRNFIRLNIGFTDLHTHTRLAVSSLKGMAKDFGRKLLSKDHVCTVCLAVVVSYGDSHNYRHMA